MFVKLLALAAAALLAWSVVPHQSGAHARKTVYRVQAYDTLWTIASSHYGGDVREAIWQIEQANHLAGRVIHPGEAIVLP
jgi:hypothetical protein